MRDDDDIAAFITNRILNLERLANSPIRVKFGYMKGYHSKYISEGVFHLLNEKDEPLMSDGNPQRFPNREACEIHCKQKNLKFQAFVKPISFMPPLELKPVKETASAPVEKKKKAIDDMPF